MALSLVGGPFTITYEGSNAELADRRRHWFDGTGLVSDLRWTGNYLRNCIIDYDGYAIQRSNGGYRGYFHHNIWRNGVMLHDWIEGWWQDADIDVLAPTGTSLHVDPMRSFHTELEDRFVDVVGGQVLSIAKPLPAEVYLQEPSPEYTFADHPGGGDYGWISPSNAPNSFWCCFANGMGFLYDYDAQTQVGDTVYVTDSNQGFFYSAELNVFITVNAWNGSAQQMRIWAYETQPFTVTQPTATPAVNRGIVSVIEVEVQGNQGEPVRNFLVDWAITAGPGTLSRTQSRTDEAGRAQTDYLAPTDSTGTVTIEATVTF